MVKVDPLQGSFVLDDSTGTIAAVMPQGGVDASSQRAHGAGNADSLPEIGMCFVLNCTRSVRNKALLLCLLAACLRVYLPYLPYCTWYKYAPSSDKHLTWQGEARFSSGLKFGVLGLRLC